MHINIYIYIGWGQGERYRWCGVAGVPVGGGGERQVRFRRADGRRNNVGRYYGRPSAELICILV